MAERARIARSELPGPRWYFAYCYSHRWLGMDWKHKSQAKWDRDEHNRTHHDTHHDSGLLPQPAEPTMDLVRPEVKGWGDR